MSEACRSLRRGLRAAGFELVAKHDTTGRRQAVAREVGETITIDGGGAVS